MALLIEKNSSIVSLFPPPYIGMIEWNGSTTSAFWGLQMELLGTGKAWYWYPYEEPSEEEHESYGPDYNFGDLDW
jgi:hypothetical protein